METSVGVDGFPDRNWRLEIQREESKVRAAMVASVCIECGLLKSDDGTVLMKARAVNNLYARSAVLLAPVVCHQERHLQRHHPLERHHTYVQCHLQRHYAAPSSITTHTDHPQGVSRNVCSPNSCLTVLDATSS